MPRTAKSLTRIKFWGVRGSIPVPGRETIRYGGNTSCVEVRADGEIIVLDAGTGIRALGLDLEREFGNRPLEISLLLTHMHWDHIQGFPFFVPSYNNKNRLHVFGFGGAESGLRDVLNGQMMTPVFPVKLHDLPGHIYIKHLERMDFNIGKVRVRAKLVNHPGICAGYRLFTSTGSMAFLPDNEPFDWLQVHSLNSHRLTPDKLHKRAASERASLVRFLDGADLLVLDTQYTDDEYASHVGWGHGSISACVALALDSNVRTLALFHHDPLHDDREIDAMLKKARSLAARSKKKLTVIAAREGQEILLDRTAKSRR
jgi:phosphoribosyl 1,2-cyclic phosphodiesterase